MRERPAPSFAASHPYLLLTLAVAFWSSNMIVGRAIRDEVPPVTLALGRWIVAFLLTLPWALPPLRRQWAAVRRHWAILALLGVLGVGCYNTFAYLALRHTSATNAAMLNSFTPVATMLLAAAVLGHRLTRRQVLGVAVSLAGVLAIVAQGRWQVLASLSFNRGDLWMLGAVAVWGIYTVALHRRPAGIDPMAQLAVFIAVGILVLLPFGLWEWRDGPPLRWHADSLLAIVYVGIFPGFLGMVCYNAGVAVVGPGVGSLVLHLMPALTPLFAFVFLGERPAWYHAVGIVAILAGILLATARPRLPQDRHERA